VQFYQKIAAHSVNDVGCWMLDVGCWMLVMPALADRD